MAFASSAPATSRSRRARVLALRVSYVGERGWELHHPLEHQTVLHDRLRDAGGDLGLVDYGYRALDSMRLEKAYRLWDADMSADWTPLPAGLERSSPLTGQLPRRSAARGGALCGLPGDARVEALLPRLIEAGVLLGIVSGALEAAAHIKLARGRLNRFFSFGGYGSDSSDRGQLTRLAIERASRIHGHTLDAAPVLVVGDTPRDVDAAHAAGVAAVGVATGKYTVAALRAAGFDYVLPTLEHLLPWIADRSHPDGLRLRNRTPARLRK